MTIHTLQPVTMIGETLPRRSTRDQVASVIVPHEPFADTADEAHLSAAAELLVVEIDGPADVRWNKIELLRARIASGAYRVASTEIASRMIEAMM